MAGVALATPALSALEPSDVLLFSKGPVTLRPQLSVSEVYNDNIFYRDENKVDDFITILSPGIYVQLGTQDYNFINAGIFYDRVNHIQESDQSANQFRFSLDSRFQKNKVTIAGHDKYEFLSSVLGGGISLTGVRVDRWTFFDEYRLTIDLTDKTSTYLEVTHSTVDFQDDMPLFDGTTLIGTLGFQYKAFERLWFFGEGYFGQTTLSPNAGQPKPPRATFMGGFFGARGFFTEKLSGTAKAGYEVREFSGDSSSVGLPVVDLSVSQRFTDNTSLTLSYSRRQRASYQFASSEYVANLVGLNYLQILGATGRLRLNVDGTYSLNEYEPSPLIPNRTDEIISAGAMLSYDFKIWLRGSFGYNYERLRSDIAGIEDYDVNRVTLGLTVGY